MLCLKLFGLFLCLFIKGNFARLDEKNIISDKPQRAGLDTNGKIHHETSENKICK